MLSSSHCSRLCPATFCHPQRPHAGSAGPHVQTTGRDTGRAGICAPAEKTAWETTPQRLPTQGQRGSGSQHLRVAGGVRSAQRTLGGLQTAQGTRVTLSASWAHSRGPCPGQTAWTVLRRCRGLSPFAFEASAAPALPYRSSSSKGPRTPRGFCAALTMAALLCHRGEVPGAPRLWPLLFPPGAAREALSGPASSLGLPPGPHHAPSALHGAAWGLLPATRYPGLPAGRQHHLTLRRKPSTAQPRPSVGSPPLHV
ncbi:PREDICTED: uncharacterized protein LOC105591607 isoform X1 [Cercocebus atys]|uniref:uncharacterized protein LOC105591607 isoform X1 n=1 Tax=Cercocebus atys TaxID=9531 RepID=UPI0005F398F1|nr:PREDICTED: uncharacterized protein LOC105591607 isoform X1 [Cercocebus atys]